MPTTRSMPESSPVALPSVRPLKRTASTASLPTPPRTRHKGRHASRRSRGDMESDDSDHNEASTKSKKEDDRIVTRGGTKKRRTSTQLRGHDEEEAEESAFWRGFNAAKSAGDAAAAAAARDISSSPPPALTTYRVKSLVSPPPSRRQVRSAAPPPATPTRRQPSRTPAPVTPLRLNVTARAPVTPTPVTPRRKRGPQRDSPNNPFLEDSPASGVDSPPMPKTPKHYAEKETLTYVFRGVKSTFANPMYNLSPSANARSLLPITDPEFSPSEACPPKLLFPNARRSQRIQANAAKATSQTPSPHARAHGRARTPELDSSDDEEALPVTPKRLTFTKEVAHIERRDRIVKVKEAPEVGSDKDDPIRRAMGPVRSTVRVTRAAMPKAIR